MELPTWHVKSTTKAQDGLYVYDTVQRLNDARFNDRDISDVGTHIARTAWSSCRSEKRKVLLIDEIDKADMEFPNDLLHELDKMSFSILETSETVTATNRPIVIITSNNEKELPDAFLRRCVFHYISFSDKALMQDIVKVHHPDIENEMLEQASCGFTGYVTKKISESYHRRVNSSIGLRRCGAEVSSPHLAGKLPFLGALLKRETDFEALVNPNRSSRSYF